MQTREYGLRLGGNETEEPHTASLLNIQPHQ
jgi:hypothetical protein